jgi:hypothetical protein
MPPVSVPGVNKLRPSSRHLSRCIVAAEPFCTWHPAIALRSPPGCSRCEALKRDARRAPHSFPKTTFKSRCTHTTGQRRSVSFVKPPAGLSPALSPGCALRHCNGLCHPDFSRSAPRGLLRKEKSVRHIALASLDSRRRRRPLRPSLLEVSC